jgi:hypothetical protein
MASSEETNPKEFIDSTENNPEEILYCLEDCKYDRKEKSRNKPLTMICCSLCSKWYHNDCVWLTKDATPMIWPCPQCCDVYSNLIKIREKFEDTVSELRVSLQRAHKDLDRANRYLDEAREECSQLKDDTKVLNDQLTVMKSRVTVLENDIQRKTWQSFRNKRSLLIGDSIIRDIDEEKLMKTVVKSIPGAKVEDVAQQFFEGEMSDEPLSNIYVCVGTNDCADEYMEAETVTSSYKSMVEEMRKQVSEPSQVVISSVLPRKDNADHQTRVETLNCALSDMAKSVGATFINNDVNFKLADGDINDGYLLPSDHLHLTKQGTNKLVKNMTIPTKQNCSDVTKSWRRSKSKPKHSTVQPRNDRVENLHHPNDAHENDSTDRDEPWQPVMHRANRRNGLYSNRAQNHLHGDVRGEQNVSYHRHSHVESQSSHTNRRRCRYCAEHSHSTNECGFRKPALCRQCGTHGHKQKFCAEFTRR